MVVIESIIIVTTLLIFINTLWWQDGMCTPEFSYGKVTGISLTKGSNNQLFWYGYRIMAVGSYYCWFNFSLKSHESLFNKNEFF